MKEFKNTNPIWLGCRVNDGSLSIEHQGTTLADGLAIYLSKGNTTSLNFTDFEHVGEPCRVNAFTIRDEGTLEAWGRNHEGVSSPQIVAGSAEYWLHVLLVAVAYAPAGAVSGWTLSAHQPDAWQTLVRVRVPPEDSKPGD